MCLIIEKYIFPMIEYMSEAIDIAISIVSSLG